MSFARLVLYFTVFSIVGYFIEVILCSLRQRKVVNRGFLFGPYLPIYGFGGIIIMNLTMHVRDNFLLTFLISMATGAIIEYFSSFLLEKIFHVRWWDYSLTDKYNLNGRICVRNTLAFGIGGCILVYSALPIVDMVLNILPNGWQIGIAAAALLMFGIDLAVSSYANSKVRKMADFSKVLGDQTNEIKHYARLAIKQIFSGPEKVAQITKAQIKKQQTKIEKRQKAFEEDMQQRRQDFEKDMQRRKKAFEDRIKKLG